MVVVAVAGGTGDVGKTVVDQLVVTGRNPIVLCRKVGNTLIIYVMSWC